MRLREPFNGIKQAQGHFFFHFALLIGSLMAVTLPAGYLGTTLELYSNPKTKGLHGLYHLIALIRVVHLVIGCAQLAASRLEAHKHHIVATVLTCALIFLYQGTILYEQFRMSNIDLALFDALTEKEQLTTFIIMRWLGVEIWGFYFYLISATIYLFWVTIRGSCGYSNRDSSKDRYKYDALDYYETDIDWFAFQTVNLLLNASTAYYVLGVYYGDKAADKKLAKQFSLYEVYIMVFMVLVRVAMFIVMPKIREEDRKLCRYTRYHWAPFYLIYLLIFFVLGSKVSDLSYSMVVLDACMFTFQAIYYQFYLVAEGAATAKKEKAKKEIEMQENEAGASVSINQTADDLARTPSGAGDAYLRDSARLNISRTLSMGTVKLYDAVAEGAAKKGFEKLIKPDLEIQNDIYSLAYAALVDDAIMRGDDTDDALLGDLQLNDREASDIYMGAILVVFVQSTVMALIIHEMLDPEHFRIIAADSFLIIVPRFLSALMMHLNVEPDIRNGIKLMKYAVNNPQCFKGVQQQDGTMKYRNVLAPFLLGFCQSTVSIVVEVMVIVYLASLNNLMDIIMKFVSMAAIVKFDDMYAASLFESKVQEASGKKLKSHFRRNGYTLEDKQEYRPCHPTEKSCFLKFLRIVQKIYRAYYVCYCYYFAPFLAVCITFMITRKIRPLEDEAVK